VNGTRAAARSGAGGTLYNHGMLPTQLILNGTPRTTETDPHTPLLWVLREDFGLTAAKYGCGIAQCGACTVHLDGEAVRSCVTPLSRAAGKQVTTLEGLAHARLREAWLAEQVPQCGYCQPGQLMSAAVLLARTPSPTDAEIDDAMAGNLCRCGTYQRIRRAIHRAAKAVSAKP
jgi:isoquinoline 1-oxidoreductase alpha subunit